MRAILAILLAITGHVAMAQNKHNLYIDVGCNIPGISATYDRKLTRHFDIGAGLSAYNFNDASYGNIRSAVYLDLRPFWLIKRNLIFAFADIGLAMNAGREPTAATLSRFGLYTAFGSGYCYQINKRGMGPYVSLGLYGHTVSVRYKTPPQPPKSGNYSVYDASLLLSLGFKF